MTDDDKLAVTVNGRTYQLTREQARRAARRMAEREADRPAVWAEAGMTLLDFANEETT